MVSRGNNGTRVCPRCGEEVNAKIIDSGFRLETGYNGIPYSMVSLNKIKYECPSDGVFVEDETGKTDYFTGC